MATSNSQTDETIISGRKQEGFAKKVGYFAAKVLAFNPTKDELNKLLGTDKFTEDIDYLGEKEGVATARIHAWIEDPRTGEKYKLGFFIQDKEMLSKDGKKYQFINSVGAEAWAAETIELPEYFTHFTKKESGEMLGTKTIRKAMAGEAKLYKFLRSWLELDYFHPETTLVISKKKIFSNDLEDLNNLVKSDIAAPVIVMATVSTPPPKEGEESKQYQNIYDSAFLPVSYLAHLRTYLQYLEQARTDPSIKPPKLYKMVETFVKDITGEDYGCRDYYEMAALKDYDPRRDPRASDSMLVEEKEGQEGRNAGRIAEGTPDY